MFAAVMNMADIVPIEMPRPYYAFQPVSVTQTDRGFILAANSKNRAEGGWDITLLEIDNDLRVVSEKVFTGDASLTVQKVVGLDEGLILLGNTTSARGDFKRTEGIQDIFMARLDAKLEVDWSVNVGGRGLNNAQDVVVSDETVTILGWVDTPGGNIPGHRGGWDVVIAQYRLNGELLWVKSLGGRRDDIAGVLLSEGDSVLAGYNSWSEKRKWDIKLVELGENGRIRWRKTVGGQGTDLVSKLNSSQAGLRLLGSTDSKDFVPEARGDADIFVMGLTGRGRIKWADRFGGSYADMAADIVETNGTVIILGWSESSDRDVRNHVGGKDLVVFELKGKERDVYTSTLGTLNDDWPLQILLSENQPLFFGSTAVSEKVLQPFCIK
jgi:hypothetical protein